MLSSVYHAGCTGCASEEQLFHTLFARYNRFIRPVENVSEPVTVHFELAITQLANVVSASDSRHIAGGLHSQCAPDGRGALSHDLKVNVR